MCDTVSLCEHYSDPDVKDWALGLTNSPVKFVDRVQRESAVSHRLGLIWGYQSNGDYAKLVEFDEWKFGIGMDHKRPWFGDLLSSDLAHERRKNIVEALLTRGDFEALEPFPEWQTVKKLLGITRTTNLPSVLKYIPRPRKLTSDPKKRLYLRRLLGQWKQNNRLKYVVFMLHCEIDRGRLLEEPVCPKRARGRKRHSYFPKQSMKLQPELREKMVRIDPALEAWMRGRIHGERPKIRSFKLINPRRSKKPIDTVYFTAQQADQVRAVSFQRACQNIDSDLWKWDELAVQTRKLGLARWYQKDAIPAEEAARLLATKQQRIGNWLSQCISTEVVAVLIVSQNRRVGRWLGLRSKLMKKGVDLRTNKQYVSAMKQLCGAIREAARLVALRREKEQAEEIRTA